MKSLWVKARVLEASDELYTTALLPLIDQARKSIVMSLYLMEPNDSASPDHPVNQLIESLIKARKRGVEVKIFLNTNFRFIPKSGVAQGKYFEKLFQAGAQMTTLRPNRRLHDKLIVIDYRYVVEGSMNWSLAALKSNFESVSIIDSPAHAKKELERIERLTLPRPSQIKLRDTSKPLFDLPETVEIPATLFEKDRLAQMIRESDMRAMDLYLILLGQSCAQGNSQIEIDLETLGQVFEFPKDWTRADIRRQIIKVLKKLEEQYQLITVEIPYAGNARIEVKNFQGEKIAVPGKLLDAGSIVKEPSGTTFLKLAREILKKQGIEIDSLSAPELEERFGIGSSTVLRSRFKKTEDEKQNAETKN